MEVCLSSSFCSQITLPPPTSRRAVLSTCNWRKRKISLQSFTVSYQNFLNFALDETRRHTHLVPSPLQEKFDSISSKDKKGQLQMLSFQAAKIRLMRSLSIETETMQEYRRVQYLDNLYSIIVIASLVESKNTDYLTSMTSSLLLVALHLFSVLDFTVFPKTEYDVPIFCANFFTTARTNIVVLDLNPLHNIINQCDYKEKYFKSLIPLGLKYAELLPWGGKLTGESIKFFSPIVIWTKFTSSPQKHDILFSAFRDYYKVWLELIGKAVEETDVSQILHNREAQHRYLTWRAETDPGQGVLRKLIGDTLTRELLRNFLFNGVDELGCKTFTDYFPEYCSEDGTPKKHGIVGKSFENRPWDTRGEFLGE